MNSKKSKVVIYFYNRLFDPLIQGNFWVFIEDYLNEQPELFTFHLVSYESTGFPLTKLQQQQIDEWSSQNVSWTPLAWHKGMSIHNKLLDIVNGFIVLCRLRYNGYRHVIAYGSTAGSFCYLFASLLGMKLYLYTYEPHSEYCLDNGMLTKESFQYKVLNFLEKKAAEFATVISSGTVFMEKRLKSDWKVAGSFFKIPSVANSKKFKFSESSRCRVRKELGVEKEQPLLFYPGKFGSLYYGVETAWMYRWLLDLEPSLHFLIVSPQPVNEIQRFFEQANVPSISYSIRSCEYDCIHEYYFAADFAIIAVPPGPSKQFISNIKVGEYLCAGLPFLITKGVSEDYLYADREDVGVVVSSFTEREIQLAWPKIQNYLNKDKNLLRQHCRRVGIEYRGFTTLNSRFKKAMDCLIGRAS